MSEIKTIEKLNENFTVIKTENHLYKIGSDFVQIDGNLIKQTEFLEIAKFIGADFTLPKGFPTHTKDRNGKTICLGDKVAWVNEEGKVEAVFEVIFAENAFRKNYAGSVMR